MQKHSCPFNAQDTRSNRSGVTSFPLLLLTLAVSSLLFGMIHLAHRWNHRMGAQVRSDRCLGRVALALRDTLQQADASDARLLGLRVSLATAESLARFETAAAIRAAIATESMIRTGLKVRWHVSFSQFNGSQDCQFKNVPNPIQAWKNFPYKEQPPDSLGPKPWDQKDQVQNGFFLKMENHHVSTKTKIYFSKDPSPQWHARWVRSDSY